MHLFEAERIACDVLVEVSVNLRIFQTKVCDMKRELWAQIGISLGVG